MEDSPSTIEALAAARDQTYAAVTARIELFIEYTWKLPQMPRRRRGGLLRPVLVIGKGAAKRLLKAATRNRDFRHPIGVGVLDCAHRRYMVDFGSYARLYADGQEWDGRSGRPLATLPPEAPELPTPLWLLNILTGATSAIDAGTDEVRARPCRHIVATIDLGRASQETPGGVAVPTRRRFEDLLALPVDVWIDDAHIRRIRFSAEDHTETLELWDFGANVDNLDWTRLPTFRSPEEAALVAERTRAAGPVRA